MSKFKVNSCENFPRCGGCSNWDKPYDIQMKEKQAYLASLLAIKSDIEILSCGEMGLRHRMDFTIEFNELNRKHDVGFYDVDKKIMNINSCLQLSPELQAAFSEFSAFDFSFGGIPVKKGSVRLRVSPSGQKGCWLDFSNLDIKNLLQDQRFLSSLLNKGYFVEIGQKGKRLGFVNNELKLLDPEPQEWFSSGGLVLKGLVSDFTQPSWISGDLLTKVVMNWIEELDPKKQVFEFGAGLGQFTLPMLQAGLPVETFEVSASASQNLETNANFHGLQKNLKINTGDFHRKKISPEANAGLALVNPARSGLKSFADALIAKKIPAIIYVSCFPESMAEDLKKFSAHYEFCDIKIIDQFPQTRHFETCVLLKKLS